MGHLGAICPMISGDTSHQYSLKQGPSFLLTTPSDHIVYMQCYPHPCMLIVEYAWLINPPLEVWGVLYGSLTPPFLKVPPRRNPPYQHHTPAAMNKKKGVRDLKNRFWGFGGHFPYIFCAFSRTFCPWDLIPSARGSRWGFLGRMVARPTNFQDPNPPPPTPVAVYFILWKKTQANHQKVCAYVSL